VKYRKQIHKLHIVTLIFINLCIHLQTTIQKIWFTHETFSLIEQVFIEVFETPYKPVMIIIMKTYSNVKMCS